MLNNPRSSMGNDSDYKETLGMLLLWFGTQFGAMAKLEESKQLISQCMAALQKEGKLEKYKADIDEASTLYYQMVDTLVFSQGRSRATAVESDIFKNNFQINTIVLPILISENLVSYKRDMLNFTKSMMQEPDGGRPDGNQQ